MQRSPQNPGRSRPWIIDGGFALRADPSLRWNIASVLAEEPMPLERWLAGLARFFATEDPAGLIRDGVARLLGRQGVVKAG